MHLNIHDGTWKATSTDIHHHIHLLTNSNCTLSHAGASTSATPPLPADPPHPDWTCPISLCIMVDPVMLPDSGITYERAAIQRWIDMGDLMCPVTRTYAVVAWLVQENCSEIPTILIP